MTRPQTILPYRAPSEEPSFLFRCFQRPIGPATTVTVVATGMLLLCIGTQPGFYYMGWPMIVFLLLLCLFGYCGMQVQAHRKVQRWLDQQTLSAPRARSVNAKRWLVLWLVVLMVLAMLALAVPLRVAFYFARPGLDALIAEIESAPDPTRLGMRRIGIYQFDLARTRQHDQVILLWLANDTESGLAYAPGAEFDGRYYNTGADVELGGGWYAFTED